MHHHVVRHVQRMGEPEHGGIVPDEVMQFDAHRLVFAQERREFGQAAGGVEPQVRKVLA